GVVGSVVGDSPVVLVPPDEQVVAAAGRVTGRRRGRGGQLGRPLLGAGAVVPHHEHVVTAGTVTRQHAQVVDVPAVLGIGAARAVARHHDHAAIAVGGEVLEVVTGEVERRADQLVVAVQLADVDVAGAAAGVLHVIADPGQARAAAGLGGDGQRDDQG